MRSSCALRERLYLVAPSSRRLNDSSVLLILTSHARMTYCGCSSNEVFLSFHPPPSLHVAFLSLSQRHAQ